MKTAIALWRATPLIALIILTCTRTEPTDTEAGPELEADVLPTCSGCWDVCGGGVGLTEIEVIQCAEACNVLCARDR